MSKAVVLLSGGLDSATTAAVARSEGYELYALTIDYGQRHAVEMESARRVARSLNVKEQKTIFVDLAAFGRSALTAQIEVPKDRPDEEISHGIPITYVPARNTVFLSLALAYAETVESWDLFLGVNAVDFSGYPDCRPAFVAAFEELANVATKAAVESDQRRLRIHAPLLHLSKAEIIRLGTKLGVDYSQTHSCYDPRPSDGGACGRCDSCTLRLKGFAEAGLADPAPYQSDKNQ